MMSFYAWMFREKYYFFPSSDSVMVLDERHFLCLFIFFVKMNRNLSGLAQFRIQA